MGVVVTLLRRGRLDRPWSIEACRAAGDAFTCIPEFGDDDDAARGREVRPASSSTATARACADVSCGSAAELWEGAALISRDSTVSERTRVCSQDDCASSRHSRQRPGSARSGKGVGVGPPSRTASAEKATASRPTPSRTASAEKTAVSRPAAARAGGPTEAAGSAAARRSALEQPTRLGTSDFGRVDSGDSVGNASTPLSLRAALGPGGGEESIHSRVFCVPWQMIGRAPSLESRDGGGSAQKPPMPPGLARKGSARKLK